MKMHFSARNSRAWWLTGKEGRGLVMKVNAQRHKALKNFGTKIILPKLETLRINCKWLHDPHFYKFPIPPKMQTPLGNSPFRWFPPLALYSTNFSPAPASQKAPFILNKISSLLELFTDHPSICLPHWNLTRPQGGHFPRNPEEDSSFFLTYSKGQAHDASLIGENLHFPYVLDSILLSLFIFFIYKCSLYSKGPILLFAVL